MYWGILEPKGTVSGQTGRGPGARKPSMTLSSMGCPDANARATWTGKEAEPGGKQGPPAQVLVQEMKTPGAWGQGGEVRKPVPKGAVDALHPLRA